MIDHNFNMFNSINYCILSIILGTVLSQLDKDPYLSYPAVIMLLTNLISIPYAVFATRPELSHGDRTVNNVLFYGNFNTMNEADYTE